MVRVSVHNRLSAVLIGSPLISSSFPLLMSRTHSGTVLDLPYRFVADGDHVEMERNEGFDMGGMLGVAAVAFGAGEAIEGMCCLFEILSDMMSMVLGD